MANTKITDLTELNDPDSTDVLPIVDVGADVTKKVTVGEVVGKISGDVDVATDGTSSIASGVIVNDDVNAAAGIAGTKIDPNFGSQTIETTGDLAINADVLFVDSSESAVGIGTTSPAVKLDTTIDSAVEWTSGANLSNTANLPFVGLSIKNEDTSITGTESSLLIQAGGSGTAMHSLTVKRTGNNFGDLIFRRRVSTASAESMRIDNFGRLLVGTSSDQSESDSNGLIQVFTRTAGKIILGREDSTVSTDDFIGILDFRSTDGGSQRTARIAAQADGDHGTDDKPGRLVFSTTADGASSPTEQLRITSDRYVRLASGTGGIQFNGDTAAANALDDYEEGTHTTTATCTSGTVTLASNTDELAYTKIGKLVSVHGRITVDTISNPTGNLTLSLPFVSADLTDSAGRCAGSIRLRIVDTGYDVGLFSCSVDENSSDFRITYGGSTDTVDAAPAMKAGTQIYISITYRTT